MFRKLFCSLLLMMSMLVSTANLSADMFTTTALPFTGQDLEVRITLNDMNGTDLGDPVKVTLDVVVGNTTNNIGDLRGFFFNVAGANNAFLTGLSVTGSDVTQVVRNNDGVTNLGGGNNINPEGPFDVGVGIGTPGIGVDDIQSTMFEIAHGSVTAQQLLVLLTTETDPGPNEFLFAVRATSVGLEGGEREGSSKLGAEDGDDDDGDDGDDGDDNGMDDGDDDGPIPEDPIPEPGTLLIFGFGAAGYVCWRKVRKNR